MYQTESNYKIIKSALYKTKAFKIEAVKKSAKYMALVFTLLVALVIQVYKSDKDITYIFNTVKKQITKEQVLTNYEHDLMISFWGCTIFVAFCLLFFSRGAIDEALKKMEPLLKDMSKEELTVDNLEVFFSNIKNEKNKKIVLDIISHLSEKDRTYFEQIMNNPTAYINTPICISILKAHLKNNPEDLRLLYNSFNIETKIPDSLQKILETYEKQTLKKETTFLYFNKKQKIK